MENITIAQSLEGLSGFAVNFLSAAVLTGLFILIYIRITPFAEFRMIHEGKIAPAISFSGALFGFITPLASAITHSVSFLDMLVWSLVALLVQTVVFLALRTFFHGLCRQIAENEPAPAILLGSISLAAGILSAACMVY